MNLARPAQAVVVGVVVAAIAILTAGYSLPSFDAEASASAPRSLTESIADASADIAAVPLVELVEVGVFDRPIEVISRRDDGRTFVVEQGGRIIAVDDANTEVILDITDLTEAVGEQGLLGAAFHPTADFLYVHYIDANGDSVLDEYTVASDGVAEPTTRREVLHVDQPFENHNGGELAFGPDGYLYIGLGDGGFANDPNRAALALDSRLGKILRIDPRAAGDASFTVPDDNPYVGVEGADPAIWSIGLRNPWKFSFDSPTGDLWIADVGQDRYEEINRVSPADGYSAGRAVSFGWSAYEGDARLNADQPADGHTAPAYTYVREDGRCSVTGGAVYRGTEIASLDGWYVFGDYCTGEIWGLREDADGEQVIIDLAQHRELVAIAVGGDGEMYAVSTTGTVSRFVDGS